MVRLSYTQKQLHRLSQGQGTCKRKSFITVKEFVICLRRPRFIILGAWSHVSQSHVYCRKKIEVQLVVLNPGKVISETCQQSDIRVSEYKTSCL